VAPDYVFVHRNIKDAFVLEMKKKLDEMIPGGAFANADYPRIISDHHFRRIKSLMNSGNI
jgi:aldehyde dehydrogenase (NAD+)